jgi:hypothetical protein
MNLHVHTYYAVHAALLASMPIDQPLYLNMHFAYSHIHVARLNICPALLIRADGC